MDKNANFDLRASQHIKDINWLTSPMKGVERKPLDRIGDEVARATTIVRYEPGSHFSPHVHTGGEEFFVLEGVFQDEHGDFPAGYYIRNPPESSHTPGSEKGCTIFVKLWQFDLSDRTHVRIDTNKMPYIKDPDRQGVELMPLFKDEREEVFLERWAPNTEVQLKATHGLEVLVIKGLFQDRQETFTPQSWLRLPVSGAATLQAGPEGTVIWTKRNHLKEPPKAPAV